MKHIYVWLFILLVAITFFLLIKYPKETKIEVKCDKSQKPFVHQIESIELKVVDLTSPHDLLNILEFKQIIAHSEDYMIEAMKFIADSSKSDQQKLIVIYCMQSLDKKHYFTFLDFCGELYCENKISENSIKIAILPGNDWNNKVILYFYSPSVRSTLKKIINSNHASIDLKILINQIINGKIFLSLFFK